MSDWSLVWIAGFKLVKASFLLIAGIAALGLLNAAAAHALTRRAMDLSADRHYHLLGNLIGRMTAIEPRTLHLVSLGSILYAMLFYAEGFGLYLDQRWAEYLTIVTTGALIPFEMFEIHRHATPVGLAVLLVNSLIVVVLARRVSARVEAAERSSRGA